MSSEPVSGKPMSLEDIAATLKKLEEAQNLMKMKMRQEKMYQELYSTMKLPHALRDYQRDA